jgi:signal transduction histidine kinase
MTGVRVLRALSAALERAEGQADLRSAVASALVPVLADACTIEITTPTDPPVSGDGRRLDLPLVVRGAAVGTLRLARAASGPDWTDDERELATEVASRVAAAIEADRIAAESEGYDEFLATLSHELRSPLSVIIGWIDLLRADRLLPEERPRALEIIDRNARLQARLIEDLVDASRIAAGKLRLDIATVPAVELVLGIVEGFRPQAETAKIELHAAADPPFDLRCDGVRLGQVVSNMVGNALRYTQRGGKVDVALTTDGETATLAIADTGCGIDPELLPVVFDRFRQGERIKIGGTRGLGLGLYIVRHIVMLHGGTVTAASAGRGKGATFTARLPLAGPPAE